MPRKTPEDRGIEAYRDAVTLDDLRGLWLAGYQAGSRLTKKDRAIVAEAKRLISYRRSGAIAAFTQSLDRLNALIGEGRK
jgi:hypothetical protein